MLKRWNEAHKKFEKEYKGLYSKVGPYLIIDEYLNTVGQCFNFFPSEEQFKLLQENLLHINDSIIDNSPVLDATQKIHIVRKIRSKQRRFLFKSTFVLQTEEKVLYLNSIKAAP